MAIVVKCFLPDSCILAILEVLMPLDSPLVN